MLIAAGLGVVVGAVLGLLGGGGSILAVPALVYGLGQPVGQAVPTSLLVVGAAAAFGAVPRMLAGEVRWRVAWVFGGTGIPTSFAGAWVNHRLPEAIVLGGFAALMGLVGVRMLVGGIAKGAIQATSGGGGRWLAVGGVGAAVGFLTGLFGVGGGFVIVPALMLILGMPVNAAVGTSLVIIVTTAAAGLVAHSGRTELDVVIGWAFAAGAVIASLVAGGVGRLVHEQRLRHGFAVLVLIVAAGVGASLLISGNPGIG